MKKKLKIKVFLLILFISIRIFSKEIMSHTSRSSDEDVIMPVNLYEHFNFSNEYAPYIRNGLYIVGPLFMAVYGFATWGWDTRESFTFQPESYKGSHAVDGASDKYGHLYGNFVMKRLASFIFKASGSSRNQANIEGAILTEIITLGGEIGDGFGPGYGFDPYDILFNNIGILCAVILDYSSILDGIFTIQWEYCPTKDMREKFGIEHHDIFTDYSGAKVILAVKLAGMPYVSKTLFRYINFDLGYYSRGYNPSKYFSTRTRNVHFGISINLSIVSGDVMPIGYISSTIQSVFNYFHLPWDIETKYIISDKTQDEFK